MMGTGVLGSWVDGAPGSTVPLDDRGLQYGDGLFETMTIRGGRVRFLDAHLARLGSGCERLGLAQIPDQMLRSEIQQAVREAPDQSLLKLIVTRGSGPRGYAPRGQFPPRRVMSLFSPSGPVPEEVTLRIATQTAGESAGLAGIKHLNRLENVLASREAAHEHCFEALMLGASGQLVGGTMSNVFLASRGVLATPGVDRAGVAGVMRGLVLRECGLLGIPVEVRNVAAAELTRADEVFVTNARIGVVPARRLGEHVFRMKEIGARLAAHIGKLDA
jgi:4-amino-4-deoxychorismate lyase